MNVQQLKAICAVVQYGLSVSAAADHLRTSQPAVSKQIRSFETEMRTDVFTRSKGRLTGITPVGEQVLFAARSTLGGIAEIRTICGDEATRASGRLVIAASASRAKTFLPDILQTFKSVYPQIAVSIVHGSLVQMTELLLSGLVSLAITIESKQFPADVVALDFGKIPRVLVVPKGHKLSKRRLSLKSIAEFPQVMYDEGYAIRDEVLLAFKAEQLTPAISMNASGAEVVKAYVAHGLGVAVLAASSFDPQSDTRIRALDADHLFPQAIARVLLSRHRVLKPFELDFINLCAPGWSRRQIIDLVGQQSPGPEKSYRRDGESASVP